MKIGKIKKVISLAAAFAVMTSATGCGTGSAPASDNSGSTDGNNNGGSGKVYNIGICQLVEHPALDAATDGFVAALTEKLGEGNVKFDRQNAQNESTNCATICNNFVASGTDLILANATGALQAASSATSDIPIIGTSITDYATALGISDWAGSTGTNITGTSDLAPIDQQEKMLVEMFPDAKQVGILYCSAEANSKY